VLNTDKICGIKPTPWFPGSSWTKGAIIHTVNGSRQGVWVTTLSVDEVTELITEAQGGRAGYYITVPAETVECAESDLSDDSGD